MDCSHETKPHLHIWMHDSFQRHHHNHLYTSHQTQILQCQSMSQMHRIQKNFINFRLTTVMNFRQYFLLVLMLATMTLTSVFLYTELITHPIPLHGSELSSDYLVETAGCRIPKTDPFNVEASRMLRRHLVDLNCRQRPLLIHAYRNTLRINYHSLQFYGKVWCYYQEIYRDGDDNYILGEGRYINKEVVIEADFVQVKCKNDTGKVIYSDFFPFIQRKEETEERIKQSVLPTSLPKPLDTFRVICLGLDSVSRNQFYRHLGEVKKFMKNHLSFVELYGYNKLGENTYPNLIPFLTGKLESEVPDASSQPADLLPLVWNEFAKAGYRTLFSEDSPEMSIFNYGKQGFLKEPTDYYLRPFSLAVEQSSFTKSGRLGCLNARREASVILRWSEDFLKTFPHNSLFSFTFLSRLSHDYFNGVSLLQSSLLKFFKHLHNQGEFQKSIMFFFGDHGFRFGTFRNTEAGQTEDKLPFAFIIVPSWFSTKYPKLYHNLIINQHRLSTPLDMYATLKNILHFTEESINVTSKERSVSLIGSKIPENRTCKDAAISNHFCSCLTQEFLPSTDNHVQISALAIVQSINNKTHSHRDECASLYLHRVLMSSLLKTPGENTNTSNSSTYYFITVLVNPGLGIFEGTVLFNSTSQTYSVESNLARINKYSNQSACIRTVHLKPFCYCVNGSEKR